MAQTDKVTVSMPNKVLWHAFRVACVQRETSASKEIQQFIERQLATWAKETQKERHHA